MIRSEERKNPRGVGRLFMRIYDMRLGTLGRANLFQGLMTRLGPHGGTISVIRGCNKDDQMGFHSRHIDILAEDIG